MSNRIRFKRVWAKNFRSIDNMGMELLYTNGTTCVGSLDNGAGKSTMTVSALYYVLFDKPYGSKATKTSLINSRSNKDCVVEAEFNANGTEWKVVRGMKPTLFEIYKDGVKIEDEAALADYAKNLEKVLGMDEKVFCNTVALGKDKFVPFVSMPAGDRRSYGEQMLDLVFVSRMNELNKDAIRVLNADILQLQTKLNNQEVEVRNVRGIIDLKKQHAAQQQGDLDDQIAIVSDQARGLTSQKEAAKAAVEIANQTLTISQEALTTYTTAMNRKRDLTAARSSFASRVEQHEAVKQATLSGLKRELDALQSQLDNSHLHENCPHCTQRMPEQTLVDARNRINDKIVAKQAEIAAKDVELSKQLDNYKEGLRRADEAISQIDPGLEEDYNNANTAVQEAQKRVYEANSNLSIVDGSIRNAINQLTTLKAKKAEAAKVVSWADEEAKVAELEADIANGNATMKSLQTRMKGHEINTVMLKDDGVKAEMVNQYLPYLNERINERLQKMNMFIRLELNNEFEVQMNAPDRRGQTIHSLSTGQQCRIDLAVMLAWRDVAKAASSCDTNILILDEILENMSEAGVADFMEMWMGEEQQDVGLYVITQRFSEFNSYFDNSIVYKLVDESTRLVTTE